MGYQRPLDYLFNESFVRFNQGRKIKQLRDLLEILRSKLTGQALNLFGPGCWQDTKYEIAQLIISMLVNYQPANDTLIKPGKRLFALKHALEYIEENADMPISVRNLCSITGVSERTLEYAFQNHFHLSPKAYLKAVRLNGVRKELRHANPEVALVTEVANAWGFWHMGQFAADYCNFFSEKPLVTLRHQF